MEYWRLPTANSEACQTRDINTINAKEDTSLIKGRPEPKLAIERNLKPSNNRDTTKHRTPETDFWQCICCDTVNNTFAGSSHFCPVCGTPNPVTTRDSCENYNLVGRMVQTPNNTSNQTRTRDSHESFYRTSIRDYVQSNIDPLQNLALMIWDAPSLKTLLQEAVENCPISADSFERKLSRLLTRLSSSLRSEAADQRQRQFTRYLGRNAKKLAALLCRRTEQTSAIPKSAKRSLKLVDPGMYPSSSEEDFADKDGYDELFDENELRDIIQFRDFITGGSSYVTFRESLRKVVYLAPK